MKKIDTALDAKIAELESELARLLDAPDREIAGIHASLVRVRALKGKLTPAALALLEDLQLAGLL